jgi:hypothetical protein
MIGSHFTARENLNPPCGLDLPGRDFDCSCQTTLFAATGQNSPDTELHTRFQCFMGIRSAVEGPMKNAGQTRRGPNERTGSIAINRAIGLEGTKNEPIRTESEQMIQISLHHFEFISRVNEIRIAGANHHKDRYGNRVANFLKQTQSRREPAQIEGRAEFQAVGTTRGRG